MIRNARRTAAITVAVAALAVAAGPATGRRPSGTASARAAPTVQMMVLGRSSTLLAARAVRLGAATIKVGGHRCAVPAGTALAGLVAARLPLHVADVAGCDPTAMFVTRIGRESNGGVAGWEYKVGHAAPSFGAGDPSGRLRSGQQLVWFWCLSANACQRTLAVTPAARAVAPGASLQVRVLGYDDNGHALAISGATVHLGTTSAKSAAGGDATLIAPSRAGRLELFATKRRLVQSFPLAVRVT